jgi:predicted metal-dependent phosphotriesterase family hydrolase
MSGGTVMTVLGLVPTEQLGIVDVHDLLLLETPAAPGTILEPMSAARVP